MYYQAALPESLGQINRSLKTESRLCYHSKAPVSQVRQLPGPLCEPVLSDPGWCLICVRSVHSACPSSFCVIPSKGYIETRRVKSGCGCHVASSRTRAQMLIPAADLPPFDLSAAMGWRMYEFGFSSTSISFRLGVEILLSTDSVQNTDPPPALRWPPAGSSPLFSSLSVADARTRGPRVWLVCWLVWDDNTTARRDCSDGRGWICLRVQWVQPSLVAESERRPNAVLILRQTLAPCPLVGAILPVVLQGTPSHRPSPYPRRRPPSDQPRLCPLRTFCKFRSKSPVRPDFCRASCPQDMHVPLP